MKTIIHVDMHAIKRNTKTGTDEPPLTIKTYKTNTKAHEAIIYDDEDNEIARIIYRPQNPLPCGARVWIESKHQVVTVHR